MNRYLFLLNPYKFFCACCAFLSNCAVKGRAYLRKAKYPGISAAHIGEVRIIGKNLTIGSNSYMNSGHISTAPDAGVHIGNWCAIGHNVTILALTHDTGIATGPEKSRPLRKGDVLIEDGVWIGSNVIITPGIKIGAMSVVGGNSVVTQDLPPYTVCAGVPCRVLFKKDEETIKTHAQIIDHQIIGS